MPVPGKMKMKLPDFFVKDTRFWSVKRKNVEKSEESQPITGGRWSFGGFLFSRLSEV
jgi:hypothetical protein